MAPGLHPPCTPAAACAQPRCHPSLPACDRPNACKQTTDRYNRRPCASAVSILATRGAICSSCGRIGGKDYKDPRKAELIVAYLKRKETEAKLIEHDRRCGTQLYREYLRKQGAPRAPVDCCAHHGHRGRLKAGKGKENKRKKEKDDDSSSGKKKKGCSIL